jgi:pimeloyl-ACP methyl ester carboxylesterase
MHEMGANIGYRMLRRLLMMAVFPLSLAGLSRDRLPRWRTEPIPLPMPQPLKSGLAPVNGISMYYAIYGHGPPILLIHGGLSNADVWSAEIPGLAAHHEVIVADSRGHGRSTMTDAPITYDLMASDYLALLDYLAVSKVAVVGWSDGGVIGLDLAIHHPDRLTALYAQAANASPDGLTWTPTAADALRSPGGRDLEEYKRLSPTPDRFIALRKAIFEMWATEPHFTREQLASIEVRTAIVIGDHDQMVRGDHTRYMANTIPGAQLIILPDVSHFALLQDPVTYVRTVLDFIDNDTTPAATTPRHYKDKTER